MDYTCANTECDKPVTGRADWCSARCYMKDYRLRKLSPGQRAAKALRDAECADRRRDAWLAHKEREARRKLPCLVCGEPFERKGRGDLGRIAKYCSPQCRSRRNRERPNLAPGAIAEFLRYLRAEPGQRANALRFVEGYNVWCSAYGVEPLSPAGMLPELKAAGFRVEGDGPDQVIVLGAPAPA